MAKMCNFNIVTCFDLICPLLSHYYQAVIESATFVNTTCIISIN